jgi:8-oxo-dGTP pyrophosphatase MutT (NUDIX family)
MLALVATEGACFARTTFAPGHFTGSVFVFSADTGRVLLHHHRRLDRWLQMGGHDEGECDPAATALREGREESGLDDLVLLSPAILDLDVHAIPPARGEAAHSHFDVRYAAVTRSDSSARADAAESLALAWLPLGEAAARMVEPGARRALAKAARLLGTSL